MCIFPWKAARPTISPARGRTDPHEVRSLHTKVVHCSPPEIPPTTQSPTPNRQDPYSQKLFGEKCETTTPNNTRKEMWKRGKHVEHMWETGADIVAEAIVRQPWLNEFIFLFND